MKIYEILDDELHRSIGTLLYYEKDRTFIIELQEDLDEWTCPLLFTYYVKKHIYTILNQISTLWIQERIIPSNRQNIQSILAEHKLTQYDEIPFLEISHGRCSQDSLYIRKTDVLPAYAAERMHRNLTECTILDDSTMLCFFADDTVRKISLQDLPSDTEHLKKLIDHPSLFSEGTLTPGGYSVAFQQSIELPAYLLHRSGQRVPLSPADFKKYIQNTLKDSSDACELLDCSRQNLSYLVQTGQLKPLRSQIRGNLYSKGDLLKTRW